MRRIACGTWSRCSRVRRLPDLRDRGDEPPAVRPRRGRNELVAGFHTEYSGITFAMFFLGEYVATVTVAAIGVTLFLGGWRGPAPDFTTPASWAVPLVHAQGDPRDLRSWSCFEARFPASATTG